MPCYYIYIHFRKDNLQPFYVGKGKGKRHLSKCGRNPHWKNIVNKVGYISQIMENNLTEEQSLIRERYYIKVLGKENLSNMTDGGEGTSGKIISEETKKKIGAKNRINNLGKITSEITKKKLSHNSPKNKNIINTETGEIYLNVKQAAEIYNINFNTLYSYLIGLRTNKTKLKYI